MLTTGNQLKAARALVGLDQETVARRAAVNVNTVRNMEAAGAGVIAGRAQNVQAVQRVLEAAGVEFLNHGKPGVRMKEAQMHENQMASYNDELRKSGFKMQRRPDGRYDVLSGQYISAAGLDAEELAKFANSAPEHRASIDASLVARRPNNKRGD
jgi:hypothetical protein